MRRINYRLPWPSKRSRPYAEIVRETVLNDRRQKRRRRRNARKRELPEEARDCPCHDRRPGRPLQWPDAFNETMDLQVQTLTASALAALGDCHMKE